MHRIATLIRGAAALAATIALLAGLPAALAVAVGWPGPTAPPSADLIRTHLNNGDIPDLFVIKLLAGVVWVLWAQLAIGLFVEISGTIAGRASRTAPLLPGIQLLAAKLVTWATLVLTALAPARPAIVAPLAPIAVTAPVEHLTEHADVANSGFARADLDTGMSDVVEAAAPAIYRTVTGDSWWSIAEDVLGDGFRWGDILNANLGRTMVDGATIDTATDTVRPGWRLSLPADATPTSPTSRLDTAEAGTVTVEAGDHFWAIAEEQLDTAWGREPTDSEIAPYWVDLVAANTDRLLPPGDPDLIYPHQRFVLPEPPPNPDIDVDLNGDQITISAAPAPDPVEPAPTPEPEPVDQPPTQAAASVTPTTTPATEVAPPTPATEPLSEPGQPGESLVDYAQDLARPLVYVAGAATFGALLLGTLRRLRHIQAARRRPGTVIDNPDHRAAVFEHDIRAIATDGEDARYIAATNRYLSHQLEHHRGSTLPAVIAARAGTHGVELLLDEPCPPVAGFVAGNDNSSTWRLDTDITARLMEGEAADAHPYAPALLVVGTTEPGDLLLDFEQLAAISIEGDTDIVVAFQRALVGGALAVPWGEQNRIVAIGIDGLGEVDSSRVEQPDDPIAWAKETAATLTAAASWADRSPYEERVDHGMVSFPTIVLIGPDPALAGIAEHLTPVAELAYSDLTLIAAAPMTSHHRLVMADGIATLEPQGIAFEPIALAVASLAATERLLVNAADTQTGPPQEWAASAAEIVLEAESADEAAPTWEAEVGSVEALIAEIMAPQPIEVNLLGRVPRVEGVEGEASGKLESIIAYLAFHGEVPAQRLREEFWPTSDSRAGADTAMMRIRNLLGLADDGSPWIPSARGNGTYQLIEVGCDWTRATRLLDAARSAANPSEEAALLDAVCELIDGHIAADASPVHYSWLLRDPGTYSQMETALVDAAHRRAELALEMGDIARANWATRKGLSVVEGQESLHRMRMRVAAEAGDTDGVNAAFREAQRAAESYGYDEEVQPETYALYESLVVRSAIVDSSTPHM